MKKTANPDAVPKKDSYASESITLTSINLHTPRPSLKPLADSEDCRVSMSAKTVGGCIPCNLFYVKYVSNADLNGTITYQHLCSCVVKADEKPADPHVPVREGV